MARLYTSGAELADLTAEGLTAGSGSVTYDTGTVRSGTYAFKADAGAGNAVQWVYRDFNGATGTTYYARAYFRSPDTPSANAGVIDVQDSAGAVIVRVRYTTGLRLNLIDSAAANLVTGPVTTTGTWYCVEVKVKVGAGATDECELLVDGVSYGALTSQTLSDNAPDRLAFGWLTAPGASKVIYLDDVALNDSSGSDQTTYAGAAHVVALKPTTDDAIGTGFTVGNGSIAVSTNLFGGIDNTPPVGVADSAATPNQIRNATSTSTANYDVTTQTYTAAGAPSNADVRVVQLVAVVSAAASTAVSGALGLINANPAIAVATSSFNTGGAAGTHPTNWQRIESAVAYDPNVTLGTGATIRIGKRSANTRVILVSQAIVLVEYNVPHALSAAASIAGTATATRIANAHPMSAAASVVGTATVPRVAIAHPLSASASIAGTADVARVKVAYPLSASASIAATASVDHIDAAVADHPMSASASIAATATANRIATAHPMSAAASVTATATAARIATDHPLSAAASVAATAAADHLATAHPLSAIASVAGVAGVAAMSVVGAEHALSAAAAIAATATANRIAIAHPLTAAASVAASADAALVRTAHPLSVSAAMAATASVLRLALSHALTAAASIAGTATVGAVEPVIVPAASFDAHAPSTTAYPSTAPGAAFAATAPSNSYDGSAP